jgi:hypothetical protein
VLRLTCDVVSARSVEYRDKCTILSIGDEHDAARVVLPHLGDDRLPIRRRKLVQGAVLDEQGGVSAGP